MQSIANENINSRVNNPFEKESFAQYRDWEESLVGFMAEQAKTPSLSSWEQLITSEKALNNACCCAIILANSIEYYYYEQSRKILQISEQLKNTTVEEFNTWIRSGWLDIPSVESNLQILLGYS